MNFKEALKWEADHVFLNPAEFAEEITLNGISCKAQVIGPHTEMTPMGDDRPGVVFETATLHFPSGLMPLPRANREISWNGACWMVATSRDDKGIFKIEIYREKS